MKNTYVVIFLIITALFLFSCSTSSSNNNNHGVGYLKIYNDTNAPITITWTADNSQDAIDSSSYRIFEFSMKNAITDPKGISTTYIAEGLYLDPVTHTDVIYLNQTTVRNLDPDRGCIRFINNTAGHIDISIPGLVDPITVGANSNYIQAWLLTGSSDVVNFAFSGDFVFTDADQMTVNLNATGSYQIYATGAAIKIRNNSPATITEVYLSPHLDGTWGTNDLEGTIAPNNYVTFTVTPNTWDVQVFDAEGFSSTWTNNSYIDLNQMLVINFSKKKHSENTRKIMGIGSVHEGPYKIQQVNLNIK
jgi:hypothetical protein